MNRRHRSFPRGSRRLGVRILLASLGLVPLLLSCGDGTTAPGNTTPTIVIIAPSDGASFDEGTTIRFQGTATDAEDGNLSGSIQWSSSLTGGLGTGASVSAALSAGTHTITAAVSDSEGRSSTTTITITVEGTTPPTVTINAPADGTTVTEGAALTFSATASDAEDGDLTGSIAWDSDLAGALGTGGSVSATLPVGVHTITATVTDSDGESGSSSITVEVVADQPPAVSITAPADGTSVPEGTAITFEGTASDPEDGDLTGSIAWSSDLDGALGNGGSVSATLSVGTHTVTAAVSDSDGQSATSSVTVEVAANQPPTVSITSPADGTTVAEGTALTFSGTASDPESGDLTGSIEWSSDLNGALGSGSSVTATLSVGAHQITARVTDAAGLTATASIGVTVTSLNAPEVTITGPADGTTVQLGTGLTFSGTATDAEDGDLTASIEWSSDIDGALGTGGNVNATLSLGTHTIFARVTDSDGETGQATIQVTVEDDQPPTATITAPTDGTTITVGTPLTFTGTATDAEDGDLTASLEWSSDIDGALGTGGSVDATLSQGTHAVSASVTDSEGQTVTVSISVNVVADQPPTVSITAPADGTTVTAGAQLTFTGSASDPEDGDLTGSIAWTSDLDGALGTGGSVDATLSLGTHTISASVTDSEGQNATATITVNVVADQPPTVDITAPADGTTVVEGTAVDFTGTASDNEDGSLTASIEWSSDLDGALGTGGNVNATLSLGTHTISASITDSEGQNATATITVNVVADQPPTVSITAPADGTSVVEGTAVDFTGTASDNEDGDLTASIDWSSDLDGALGTGGNVSATLSQGTHTVTASVTDSEGQTVTDQITVTVTSSVMELVNGENHDGSISTAGETDEWTFDAAAGDFISINIGEVGTGMDFSPWIRLVSPSGALVTSDFGGLAAQVTVEDAPETGKYRVLVGSNDSGQDGTGDYRLTLVHVPGTFTVPAGDEGGAMTNGENHTGSIHLGDFDQWTFEAAAGDWISVNIGEVGTGTDFSPWIRLVSPSGAAVTSDFGGLAAQFTVADASESGTYTVVVGTNDSGRNGTGDYQLTLAKVPGTFTVPAGDEGGAMTNGTDHAGTIQLGDLDLWTFSATTGESFTIDLTETNDISGFAPWIRVISPTGDEVASDFGGAAAQITVANAPETGTYTVIVGTNDSGRDGVGEYLVTLTK